MYPTEPYNPTGTQCDSEISAFMQIGNRERENIEQPIVKNVIYKIQKKIVRLNT